MRHSLTTLLAVLLIAVATTADAQGDTLATEVVASASADTERTHNEIRELRDALIKTVNSKDLDSLTALLHEDVLLTAQDGDQLVTIRKRAGVQDYINRLLVRVDAPIRQMTVAPIVDELAILHGDDTGIASGSSVDDYVLRDGSEFRLNTRWSATVVATPEGWQVASLHVSSNLFDNPVLQTISRFALIAAVVAAVSGLLVGFVLARLMKSRKGSEVTVSQ